MDNYTRRWIEIQFSILCHQLYHTLNDYPIVVEYLETLADLARIPREKALKALQAVTQINRIRPSNAEFTVLARRYNIPISKIMSVLKISKPKYIEYSHYTIDIVSKPQCAPELADIMKTLVEKHNMIKGAGV